MPVIDMSGIRNDYGIRLYGKALQVLGNTMYFNEIGMVEVFTPTTYRIKLARLKDINIAGVYEIIGGVANKLTELTDYTLSNDVIYFESVPTGTIVVLPKNSFYVFQKNLVAGMTEVPEDPPVFIRKYDYMKYRSVTFTSIDLLTGSTGSYLFKEEGGGYSSTLVLPEIPDKIILGCSNTESNFSLKTTAIVVTADLYL